MTGAVPLPVELKDVSKNFGPVQAVRSVDVSIASGEIVAMLGPNGAGKTSTIDIILGLSRQTSGQALVFGMHPRQAVTHGLVSAGMQTGGLLKDLTVKETVQYTASLFAQSKPTAEVLDRAGITQIADRRVGKCSGGEQQRLRFAMALVSDPELLVLDEPTTGMDVEGRAHLLGVDPQGRRAGQDGTVRHALPGGSGRLCRPGHPAAARAEDRGRNKVSSQCAVGGAPRVRA